MSRLCKDNIAYILNFLNYVDLIRISGVNKNLRHMIFDKISEYIKVHFFYLAI